MQTTTVTAQTKTYHGLSSAEYQEVFDRLVPLGYRPISIEGYEKDGTDCYDVKFSKKSGSAWVARHGLSDSGFRDVDITLGYLGYRLHLHSVFLVNGRPSHAALWMK